jgi:hypothetical protein
VTSPVVVPFRRTRPPAVAASAAVALLGALASSAGAQVVCDTLRTQPRFASLVSDRPFTGDSANGEVVARRGAAVAARGRAAAAGARGVRKDAAGRATRAAGTRVTKDSASGVAVRKERSALCVPLTSLPGGGTWTPVAGGTYALGGEVDRTPQYPESGLRPRGGWLSLPPLLGGLFLGAAALAFDDNAGGTSSPVLLGPPTTPTLTPPPTPTAPTPGTPTTPTPGTPTTPTPTPPTPDTPPGTPTLPVTPVTPTVAPEPGTVLLVAAGGLALVAVRRRRR